jgi:hypothetical protein
MPSTVNRGYSIPATGSEVDVWGSNDLNPNFGAIDTNLGGVVSIATTGGVITLNAVQLASGTISVSGALSNNAIITFPAIQGWWSIENLCTNIEAFTLFVACGTATTLIGIPPGEIVDIQINGNVPKYRNLGRVGSYLDDCGAVVPLWISGSTIPPYLNCNGTTFSGTTYPVLAARLGTTTLPDIRGTSRYALNQGTGRLTSAVSGLDGNTRFALKTSQSNSLITSNLPPYTPAGSVSSTSSSNNVVVAFGQTPTGVNIGSNISVYTSGNYVTASANVSSSFTGAAQGGSSTPFGVVGPGTVSGITLIRAA